MSRIEKDLEELSRLAVTLGASRAKPIPVDAIVVDERVQLKCRYPPCPFYGRNRMCPPFTPTAEDFRKYLARYKHALIVQLDVPLTEDIKSRIRSDAKLEELLSDKDFSKTLMRGGRQAWRLLNHVISGVERESFKKGYRFAVGFAAGSCPLCDECDVNEPCKHPLEARPSMEAVGIDVQGTLEKVGLSVKWCARDIVTLTGLILID
ncbi:MAG: DUF2284 domain-containing protein [Candidatus Jordarchaeales archaeon]|nr:DUF2284 domain-containing protein [Candidatus Jordarchaeia archaeon]